MESAGTVKVLSSSPALPVASGKGVATATALSTKAIFMKVIFGAVAAAILSGFIAVAAVYGFRESKRPVVQSERVYHLQVEEVLHDFTPSGTDLCTGTHLEHSDAGAIFTVNDPAGGYIGSKYWRRHFVGYTPDGTFSTPLGVEPQWEHLAALGPVLRAHVGDTLRVRLRNKSRFPASFSVHGLQLTSLSVFEDNATAIEEYNRKTTGSSGGGVFGPYITAVLDFLGQGSTSMEETVSVDGFGAGYRTVSCKPSIEGESCALDETISTQVPPGRTIEYAFSVPVEAGPAPGEHSSVARLYQSLSYQGHDVALSGVLVVTARPDVRDPTKVPPPSRPSDVTAEAVHLYSVNNENESPYLGLNLLEFVYRGRVAASSSPTTVETAAIESGSPVFPIPHDVAPGVVIAALYNAAVAAALEDPSLQPAGGIQALEIDENDVDVVSAVGAPGDPWTTTSTLATLHGLPLGITLHPASQQSSGLIILDATSFVSVYGQVAAEGAIEGLYLPSLEVEGGFDPDAFEESNLMHAVNGRMYCNVDGLNFKQGDTVRWYTAVIGTEVDLHAVHWHGNTLLYHSARTDSISLLPRQIVSADMAAHSPGTWMLHCHVTDHIHAGMIALYTVEPSTYTSVRLNGGAVEERVPTAIASELNGRLRNYYVAAELVAWDYVSQDVLDAASSGGHRALSVASSADGCGVADIHALSTALNGSATYGKVVYAQYTDDTFTTRVPRSAEWAHLGINGPVIRGEVGDVIKVHFRNKSPSSFSVHPHGVAYPKTGEGAPYEDGTEGNDKGDDSVTPDSTWVYTWWVPESSGPGPADPSSLPWLYHGHVHETNDENTGLVGVIVITGRGKARTPGSANPAHLIPADVDREFVVLTKAFDEGATSEEVNEYVADNGLPPPLSSGGGHNHRALAGARRLQHGHNAMTAEETYSLFFAVNGKAACSLEGLEATSGERVRWYFTSLGNEIDLHHMGVTGHTMTQYGKRVAGVSLLPGTMYGVDMVAGQPGNWLLTSNVRHHAVAGMVARFTVNAPTTPPPAEENTNADAQTRTYYIAAEEVTWDYAPAEADLCMSDAGREVQPEFFSVESEDERYDLGGMDMSVFPMDGRIFVGQGLENGTTIGRKYKKAVYTGYSHISFGTRTFVPGSGPSLRGGVSSASTGLLGPTVRAAVGDTLEVYFRNELDFDVNFAFPHGPVLTKLEAQDNNGEWVAMVGSVSDLSITPIQPGHTVRYTFEVPTTAGPAAFDASTIAWPYMSTVANEHLFAGLVGPAIIAQSPSGLLPGMEGHGAQKEYVLAWYISNENESPYLDSNVQEYVINKEALDTGSDAFMESNLMHAVNGRLFCNLEGLKARVGETVRLHMLGLGAELDMHTPQVHGQLLTISNGHTASGSSIPGSHAAVLGIHPGSTIPVDVTPTTPGVWLMECGVNDHWGAGMRANLVVDE